ncbi:hypothetical protein Dimus_038200 [Dionaea muscipula]
MVETRTGPKGPADETDPTTLLTVIPEMDPMQKMMMMMMETQRMMLASMEAREQREEIREAKFAAVLDKISSKLDRLEVTQSIPSAAVDDTHNTGVDLSPNPLMGTETQNPQPVSSVLDRGKAHIHPNPIPQASTHQFGTSQIVSPREPTPQFPPKTQYPPLLINPHKPQQTPHQASSSHLPPLTPPQYPPYTPPYNLTGPPQQYQTNLGPPPHQHHFHLPKLDFLTFDGTEVRSWIRRAERYFSIMGIDEWRRVKMAAMYLIGKAEIWLYGAMARDELRTWDEFKEAVATRFDGDRQKDVVEEFNRLIQRGRVEEYVEKFEEGRYELLQVYPHQSEEYFISSFVGGLKEEIKAVVKMFKPRTLFEAFHQAKLQEMAIDSLARRSKPTFTPKTFTTKPLATNTKPPRHN